MHAGDFVAVEVLEELSALGPVAGVHGNMDEPALRALLPESRIAEVGEARVGVVHDGGPRTGRGARLTARFADCDAVVFGHSHLPEVSRHGDVWVLNPGSPTERRRAPAHTMIRLVERGGLLRPRLLELP